MSLKRVNFNMMENKKPTATRAPVFVDCL